MDRSSGFRKDLLLPLAAATLWLAACEPPVQSGAITPAEDVERTESSEATGANSVEANAGARTATAARATAALQPASDSDAGGTLSFAQGNGYLRITGEINGLSPGLHGLHVHEIGDCSAPDASSAGAHYAPRGSPHGAPTQTEELHHAGDLGNIVANASGRAAVDTIDDGLTLSGPATIVGRAIVVHADADDLVSQPAGNAGDRVACGVIEVADVGRITG